MTSGNDGQTGPTGETGNGIASITKTGTSGLVDTYTITYTNGNTTTFTVTNGEDANITRTEFEELKQENEDLKNNQLTGEESGQSIYLSDSADSRVRSIGLSGNSEQESTTGKNKFNGNAVTTTHTTNWTISFENDTLSITHNNSYTSGSPIANLGVLSQGTYIISGIFTRAIGLYRDNSYSATIRNGSTFSANGTEEIELYFAGSVESGATDTYKKLQIETGSTATPYEPYTGGEASPNPSYPQEIHSTGDSGSVNEKVQNKNLFDKNDVLLNTAIGSDGLLKANEGSVLSNFILVNENTNYYLRSARGGNYVRTYAFYNKNKELISFSFLEGGENVSGIITTPNNTKYLRVVSGTDYYNNCQLEQGSTATDYTAHEEQNISIPTQQPMRSNKNKTVVDGFVNVDGNRIERHYIGRLILTGEEDIEGGNVDGGTTGVSKRFYITHNLTNFTPANTSDGLMCSNFVVGSTYGNDDTLIQLSSTLIFLRINVNDYSNLTTKNELKAWLAQRYANGNPVYIDYILSTPLDLLCTEEQQAVWEQIKALRTYKPVTHISSTDEVPATVDITYVRDLETVINNLSN